MWDGAIPDVNARRLLRIASEGHASEFGNDRGLPFMIERRPAGFPTDDARLSGRGCDAHPQIRAWATKLYLPDNVRKGPPSIVSFRRRTIDIRLDQSTDSTTGDER